MLVPIYLGLCRSIEADAGHAAADQLISGSLSVALAVAFVHTAAMMLAGGALATGSYRWLGARFRTTGDLNFNVIWPVSLITVGVLSVTVTH